MMLFMLPHAGHAETWLGVEAGIGSAEYRAASDHVDLSWSGSIYARQDFGTGWGVLVGLHTGSGTSVPAKDIGVATEADAELEFRAVSLCSDWRFPLTGSQALYASVGLNYNQTDVELKSVKKIEENGIGYNLRAGWQYHFGQHNSLNLGLKYLELKDVDVHTVNIGYEYHF
jgi:opacity protein-like surface antigen